jgi:hypothetical protein
MAVGEQTFRFHVEHSPKPTYMRNSDDENPPLEKENPVLREMGISGQLF